MSMFLKKPSPPIHRLEYLRKLKRTLMENSSMTKSDFRSFRKIGKDILSNNTLYFLNESLRVMDDLYLPDYCEKVAEALKASIKSQKEKYIMIFRYKGDDLEAWERLAKLYYEKDYDKDQRYADSAFDEIPFSLVKKLDDPSLEKTVDMLTKEEKMSFAFPYLSGRTLSLPFSILEEAIYSPQVDTLYLLEQFSLEKIQNLTVDRFHNLLRFFSPFNAKLNYVNDVYYIVDKSYLLNLLCHMDADFYGCNYKRKERLSYFFQGIQAPNFTEDSPLYSYLMEQEIREEAAMHALAEKKFWQLEEENQIGVLNFLNQEEYDEPVGELKEHYLFAEDSSFPAYSPVKQKSILNFLNLPQDCSLEERVAIFSQKIPFLRFVGKPLKELSDDSVQQYFSSLPDKRGVDISSFLAFYKKETSQLKDQNVFAFSTVDSDKLNKLLENNENTPCSVEVGGQRFEGKILRKTLGKN